MNNIKTVLYKKLLPTILSRPCGRTIPIGDAAANVNCFFVAMDRDKKPYLKFVRIVGQNIECLEWDMREFKTPKQVSIDAINDYEVHITHYYGPNEIRFNGIFDYVLTKTFPFIYLKVHIFRILDKLNRHFFNKKKLVTKKRIELLTYLVQKYSPLIQHIDSVDLMTDLYSIRWVQHPEGDSRHKVLELYLESLVQTGELKKIAERYQLGPKALTTIEEYEEDERKHTENVKTQRNIFWVTVVIAILTLVQAGLIRLPTLIDLSVAPSYKTTK